MLDRYVNDEFKAVDKDFSNSKYVFKYVWKHLFNLFDFDT